MGVKTMMTWSQIIPEYNVLQHEELEVDHTVTLAGLHDDPENNNFDYPWEWKDMAILGRNPEDKLSRILDRIENEGIGYHTTILSVAGLLKSMNVPANEALEMMYEASERVTRRKVQPNELENAIEYSYNQVAHSERYVRPQPKIDRNLIERVSEVGDVDKLQKESDDCDRLPGEFVLNLYDDQELLFIATELFNGETMSASDWMGHNLGKKQFICPNPLKNTEEGRKEMNIRKRKYLVFETDDDSLAKQWHSQAGCIDKLRAILKLKMVVYSGNKSLHAWFSCENQAESQVHRFENMAIKLGADRATLRQTQLVRMPNGKRDNGKVQKVIYWNE